MTIEEYRYWLPPTDAHLIALGRIVVESATLESVLEIALWQVMQTRREIGELITNRPNLGQRLEILNTIFPVAFPSEQDRKEFDPIRRELKSVVALRNHLLHAQWGFGTRQDRPFTINARNEKGEIVPRQRYWKPEALERIAARIGRVGDELIRYLETRGVSLPPQPSRSWKRYQVPPEPKWPSKKSRARPPRRAP